METADVVVLLHRPDTDERDHPRIGEADLAIVKNRYGAPGKVTIAHQLHYARFASMAAAPPPPPSPPQTPPRPAASPPPATRLRPKPQPAGGRSNKEEQLIVAGDVEVMMRSVGAGNPPVICLGRAEPADDKWTALTERLEGMTRTISYRRPGCGGPDPLSAQIANGLHTIDSVVTRLDTMLDEARISPPFVLVAGSIGAWIADRYAARSPRDIAGMVLIDPTNLTPWPDLEPEAPMSDGNDGETGYLLRPSADGYAELARLTPSHPRRTVVISSTDGRWQHHPPRHDDLTWNPSTLAQIDRLWQGYQRDWVHRLNARHVIATDAGHLVHRDQPDLVARIVTDVVHATRSRESLHLDQGAIAHRGGRIMPRK